MTQPITAATDFLLGVITAFWAMRVWRASDERASRLFALALGATALSTLLGGLYHTFPSQALGNRRRSPSAWSLFPDSISFAFLSPRITKRVRIILLVQLCAFSIAVLLSDDF